MRRTGLGLWALLLLALAACAPKPQPADPALWMVEGPNGETAWLFGTIHALERPVLWRSRLVERALARSDTVVVEIDELDDDTAMAAAFAKLAASPELPPLSSRVDSALRDPLAALLDEGGMTESQFAGTETWAAALMLARVRTREFDSAHGIDRAVIEAAEEKRVVELEGAEAQLGLFDALPEKEQRDLLEAVVRDAGIAASEGTRLAEAWRKGDIAAIEQETRRGMLADPELRQALFTGRNRAWADRVAAMLAGGARPFVAVGAAHLAGPDGLVALLEAKGYRATRVQ
jgi:uncharacterized protein YbaP (TraB family)